MHIPTEEKVFVQHNHTLARVLINGYTSVIVGRERDWPATLEWLDEVSGCRGERQGTASWTVGTLEGLVALRNTGAQS